MSPENDGATPTEIEALLAETTPIAPILPDDQQICEIPLPSPGAKAALVIQGGYPWLVYWSDTDAPAALLLNVNSLVALIKGSKDALKIL